MSIIKSKGTVFSMGVGGASTAIAQIISLDLPEQAVETFEADTLDNSGVGIPYKSTGRVEGGSVGGELFFNTTTHSIIIGFLTSPPDPDDDPQGTGSITFGGGGGLTFEIAGISLGGSVALNDGVKGTFNAKLDGVATYTT